MNSTPDYVSLLIAVIAISLLPFAAMVVTSYTKIVVVLGLLRNAIGVQQVPPSMVLNGIAMIVSCFIMAPVAMEAVKHAQGSDSSTQIVAMLDAADTAAFRRDIGHQVRSRG